MLAVVAAMSAQAQIGYKGQVTAAVDGGITHLGGYVGAARIGAYLSPHSVLGGGVMFDKTRCCRPEGFCWEVRAAIGCHVRAICCLIRTSSCTAFSPNSEWSMYSAGIGR